MEATNLDKHHLDDLQASGLSLDTIAAARLFSATADEVCKILGFNATNSSGLAFPYPVTDWNGCLPFIRIKPDTPPVINGKQAKYLSQKGSINRLYVPPGVEAAFTDSTVPLYVTEGEKKALKAVQEGLQCVALAGVWCWKTRAGNGESEPIQDLGFIEWSGRPTYIIFDSDATHKREIRHAEQALAKELMSRGAVVRVIRLPASGKEKVGLDDYLLSHTVQDLLQLLQENPIRGKAKADAALVADHLKAQHDDIKRQISAIRACEDLKAFQRKREVSQLILSDLKQRGSFYRTPAQALYFFAQATKTLFPLEGVEFARRITDVYGINRSEEEFRYLLEELGTDAYTRGILTEIRQFAHYDPNSGILYISNNQNQMYRLDGQEVRLVDNGTDGILFLPDPLAESFTYLGPEGTEDQLIHRIIIDRVNFAAYPHCLLTREEYQLLLLLYLLALPFEALHPTKPLALFTGPKGSGKTWTLKAIGLWLFGYHFNVTSLSKDKEDAFVTTICSRSFVAYDNVDGRITWLNDRLATAATGQRIELRKLYTTNETAVYFPRCFIALTARTPKFKRDDVVDRLLIFRVERISKFQSEAALIAEILQCRDALWTEYLNDLNLIVAGIRERTEPVSTAHRMADFATFAYRVGKILGRDEEVLGILTKLAKEQSEFLLEDEPIAEALASWLEDPSNFDRPIASGDLFRALEKAAQKAGATFPFKSSVGFGQRLKNLVSNLEEILDLKIHVAKGRGNKTLYTITRRRREEEISSS